MLINQNPTTIQGFLPHVDIEQGLGRLVNNKKLFARLVGKFLEDTSSMNTINELMAAGNIEEALKAIHAMKGTSGNLSFIKLNESAIKIEADLKGDGANKDAYLAELNESYSDTIQLLPALVVFLNA